MIPPGFWAIEILGYEHLFSGLSVISRLMYLYTPASRRSSVLSIRGTERCVSCHNLPRRPLVELALMLGLLLASVISSNILVVIGESWNIYSPPWPKSEVPKAKVLQAKRLVL